MRDPARVCETRGVRSYRDILTIPGAWKFSAAGLLARSGGAMMGIGIVLMVSALYSSYGLAGLLSAANGVGWAVGTAFLSTLVDRYGQRRVMYPSTVISAAALALLVVFAVMRLPAWTLFAPAVITGAAGGAPGALVRARWNHVTSDPHQLHTAYALESTLDELTFAVGPVFATALSTGIHPAAALVAPIVLALLGAQLFYSQRATEPPPSGNTERGGRGPLMPFVPGVGPVMLVTMFMGCAFGAMSVSVVAATSQWGVREAAGAVLGTFSVASGVSGFWYGTRAWSSTLQARFVTGVVALGVFATGLLFTRSVVLLIVVGVLFGVTVAPTFVNANSVVGRVVPAGRLTEGLSWLGTGIGIGVSIGQSVSGRLIDAVGYRGGFVTVAAFALAAAVAGLVGLPVLRRVLNARLAEVSGIVADVG